MITFRSNRSDIKLPDPDNTTSGRLDVLVVEEDLVISRCLLDNISMMDTIANVHVARNEDEAAEFLSQCSVDIAILDPAQLKDPNLDAPEILDSSHLKCIFFTAHEKSQLGMAMARCGFAEFVYKTEGCTGLRNAILRLADQNNSGSTRSKGKFPQKLSELSARERQAVIHLGHGLTLKEAAVRMDVNPKTVETYKSRAFSKLGISTRADLVGIVALGLARRT